MSKKVEVYQKFYKLVADCQTQKEARRLVKEIKMYDKIKTNSDFRIVEKYTKF